MTQAIFPAVSDYKNLVSQQGLGGTVDAFGISLAAFQYSALEMVIQLRDNTNVSFTTPCTISLNSGGLEVWSEMRTVKTGAAVPVAVQSSASGNALVNVGNLIGTNAPASYVSTIIIRIFGTAAARRRSVQYNFWHPFDGNANQNWGEIWRLGISAFPINSLLVNFTGATLHNDSNYFINRIMP